MAAAKISILDEHLVPSFSDGRQESDHEKNGGDASRPPLTGWVMKVSIDPREMMSARRRFSSISLPSTKPSSSGAGSKPNLISA